MSVRTIFPIMLLAACGGGENTPTPDAPEEGPDIGFNRPTASLKANMEVAEDMWEEIGPADLACLNTASADMPTTVAVALSTVVRDFQSDNLVPNAAVTAFLDQDIDKPFFTGAADGNAAITVDIPAGTRRFGYKMVDDSALDTLLLNQTVDPDNPTQTVGSIQSVSKSTAQTLPALIGISRTAGTGVLAGAIRDCQEREISNFIATVTLNQARTAAEIQHAPGTDTYYFSSSVGLPVRHTQKPMGSEDGLFMIVELAPTALAYVQVWGYITDADIETDNLTLIAELETSVIADTVITGSYEPLRTN
jgi:hypothetical protein